MTADLRDPSVGLDAATGGILTGWEHVVQSLLDIFDTRFGSRIMREWYGSRIASRNSRRISPGMRRLIPIASSIAWKRSGAVRRSIQECRAVPLR